jgi:hypothetical protein
LSEDGEATPRGLIAVSVAGSAPRDLRAAARGCLIPDAGPRIADADLSSRRSGEFPRSRMVGDRTVWVEREIDAWIAALPNRQLKGDAS